MSKLHTPSQFNKPSSLTGVGLVGVVLGCALVVRAFDTGSWWQYFGALTIYTLSFRLFLKAFKIIIK